MEWDSPQNTLAVRERVAFLTYGYGCKTGCGTARCKCVKSKHRCRPGCSYSKHVTCVNRGESIQGNVLIDKISPFMPVAIIDIQS